MSARSDDQCDAARKDIDAMTQPLRSWTVSRGYSIERTRAAIAALDDFVDALTRPSRAASND